MQHGPTSMAILLGALALTSACADAGAGAGTRVERADSAGVAVVRNLGPDVLLPVELEPVVRIGSLEGPQAFSRIHDGSVGSDGAGNLYVLDTGAHRILVFDRSGTLVREMGRKGGGPGELQYPSYLAVAEDGTVTVTDFAKGLVTFAPDGTPAGERRRGGALPSRIAVGAFGIAGVVQRRGEPGDSMPEELMLLSGEDSVVVARTYVPMKTDVGFPDCPVRISGMAVVLAPELVWGVAGERFAVSRGAEYVIDLYDHAGRLAGSVRRDVAPTPATVELASREVGDSMRIQFGSGSCAIPPEHVVEARGYAPMVPAVRRMVGAPDGSWWVGRGVGRGADAPWTIDVFAADGEYLGTLPEGTPFPAAFRSADEALVVERDELDVPSLVVYRMRWPARRG